MVSAYLSVKEAAELAGVSKSALFKAINTGRLSAEKEANGAWKIQVVELERAYSLNGHSAEVRAPQLGKVYDLPQGDSTLPTDRQQVLIEQLQLRIQERDETIADLRQRLDAESDERRRLSMMLTVATTPPASPAPVAKRKGFWARLFGGGE